MLDTPFVPAFGGRFQSVMVSEMNAAQNPVLTYVFKGAGKAGESSRAKGGEAQHEQQRRQHQRAAGKATQRERHGHQQQFGI